MLFFRIYTFIMQALAKIGYGKKKKSEIDPEALLSDKDRAEQYSLELSLGLKVLSALACGAVFFLITFAPLFLDEYASVTPAMQAFWAVFFAVSYVITLMDLKARIIPWELCGALLILGIAYQGLFFGIKPLLISVVVGIIVYIVFELLEKALAAFGNLGSIGGGDMRILIPIIVSLGVPNVFYGLLAMSVALVVFWLVGKIARKINRKTLIPLAPFFTIWLMSGLILPYIIAV